MAGNTFESIGQLDIEVLVPYATDFSLEDWRNRTDGDQANEDNHSRQLLGLSSIPLRTSLHFDEQIKVIVVLRTSGSLVAIQEQLPYLTLDIEAQAFGSEYRNSEGSSSQDSSLQPQRRDVIWSGSVDTTQGPVAIDNEDEGALAWALGCFLGRPRVRMQHPMISFKASGVFRHPPASTSADPEDRFLPSGVPASTNVLEPLSGDPRLRGIKPQLTALRLDHISPSTTLTAMDQVIQSKPQRPFPALPAISARVRYSKSGAFSGRPSVIASLDIETSPFQDNEIDLTDVRMRLSDGSVEDLCIGHALRLPMRCQPRDNIVFLFRLLPSSDPVQNSRSNPNSRALDILLDAHVLASNMCRPKIQMRWKTTVDFSIALSVGYVGPSQAMQRSTRPPSLPVAPVSENRGTASQDLDVTPDTDDNSLRQQATVAPDFGVTMTLTAPKDVYVGQPFTWDVFLVNRSSKARKLAIVVIPKRTFADHKSHMPKTSTSSAVTSQRRDMDHADAVMEENRLYAMQKSNGKEAVGIVCLSTDVRLGSLNPGFCHNAELKFLPLAKGVLQVEAVRVIDLVTNNAIDIRTLPEIPLLHSLILLVEMVVISRLMAKFNSYYADKPVLTITITNAVLGGIADTVAQTLTAIRSKQKRPLLGTAISDGIEMPDYDEKGAYNAQFLSARRHGPPPFDFERLTRFMSYGFIMSPVQFHWFSFLSRTFPITKQNATLPVFQRMAFDQLIFAPIGLACFFTFMTVTEGGGRRAVARKFQDVYLPSLKANFMVWPAVQILNFRVIPLPFQIPLVSTVGIAWTAYLSLTNSSDEPLVPNV
ncbi:MAG: hypothetical protein Q9181_001073 [Wetmoreana brouardii]